MHDVAVIGARGFGGALCARIVDRHPSLRLAAATARERAGQRHDELYARYGVKAVLEEFDPDAIAERAEAALVAYPHKAAAGAVSALRERGLKVVDLSADFRLDRERYERWYQPHQAPELLDEAVYGLPEAAPRADPRGASWWRARAATPPRRCWRCCRCRAHRGDGGGHQGRRVGRRARGHGRDPLRLGRSTT